MTNKAKTKETFGEAVFGIAAVICIIAVIAIFAFLIIKSVPAFNKLGIIDFVFGDNWAPDRNDTFDTENISGSYGIFAMIVGTFAATVGALLFGGILGYFTAVFIVFFCPRKLKRVFSSVINLLAGIPSVVYGFFGIVFLLPLLSNIASNNGSGLFATSIVLGIMILPTVVSLSKTSLEAVPTQYYEGAVALGSNHSEAAFRVVVPAAKSGIMASLVLGVGRALGETMAVVMVAGNAPTYPNNLFTSFRVMTANIVMEMGYAGELQEGALMSKPFSILELMARVKTNLRRANLYVTNAGGFTVDNNTYKILYKGEDLKLTLKEFKLFKILIGQAGITVNREALFREVWGEDYMGETRTLDMHMATLRDKIKNAGGIGECIVTVRGIGYRFESI